jgi:hypothetical protein
MHLRLRLCRCSHELLLLHRIVLLIELLLKHQLLLLVQLRRMMCMQRLSLWRRRHRLCPGRCSGRLLVMLPLWAVMPAALQSVSC